MLEENIHEIYKAVPVQVDVGNNGENVNTRYCEWISEPGLTEQHPLHTRGQPDLYLSFNIPPGQDKYKGIIQMNGLEKVWAAVEIEKVDGDASATIQAGNSGSPAVIELVVPKAGRYTIGLSTFVTPTKDGPESPGDYAPFNLSCVTSAVFDEPFFRMTGLSRPFPGNYGRLIGTEPKIVSTRRQAVPDRDFLTLFETVGVQWTDDERRDHTSTIYVYLADEKGVEQLKKQYHARFGTRFDTILDQVIAKNKWEGTAFKTILNALGEAQWTNTSIGRDRTEPFAFRDYNGDFGLYTDPKWRTESETCFKGIQVDGKLGRGDFLKINEGEKFNAFTPANQAATTLLEAAAKLTGPHSYWDLGFTGLPGWLKGNEGLWCGRRE